MKNWQIYNHTEPAVACALADFVFPGDIVFDVGSHIGGITTILSRLVGPMGKVVAFEANPVTADVLCNTAISNALFNVFPVNRAIFDKSNVRLSFFSSNSVGDSIINQPWFKDKNEISVLSLSLGDYISTFKLSPTFLKFDIEGAELLGLQSMKSFIEYQHPILILEQSRDDFACLEMLIDMGYIAVDLHNYKKLESKDSYPQDVISVRNVVCIHKSYFSSHSAIKPYIEPQITVVALAELIPDGVCTFLESAPLDLLPGRYFLNSTCIGSGSEDEVYLGVIDHEGRFITCNHAVMSHFVRGRVEMPFHLDEPMSVRICFRTCHGVDITKTLDKYAFTLNQVDGFGLRLHSLMVLGG